MANTKYTYSITDFPNNKANAGKLYVTILEDPGFTYMVDSITVGLDEVDIWFRNSLSQEELTTLSGIVAEHDGEEYIEEKPAIDQSMYGKTTDGTWVPMSFTDDGRLRVDVNSPPHGNEIHTHEFATVSGVNTTISGALEDITDTKVFDFAIRDASKDYFECNNTSWYVALSFSFPGTSICSPEVFQAILSRDGENGFAQCRLFDFTHNTEIAYINFQSKDKAIYTDSSLDNLPSGQALFEVQIKKEAAASSKIRLHSCVLR